MPSPNPYQRRLKAVGARIALAIEHDGRSQTAIASQIGTTQPTVSRWSRGENLPEIETLLKLADALRVSPASLLQPLLGEPIEPTREDVLLHLQEARRNIDQVELQLFGLAERAPSEASDQ